MNLIQFLKRKALFEASRNENLFQVKFLKQSGALNSSDVNRALSKASQQGHLKDVKFFVQAGADPRAGLKKACSKGHLEVVKNLSKRIRKDPSEEAFREAFATAVWQGHLEVVKFLVQEGADSEAIRQALVIAVWKGHPEIVKFLVQAGADSKAIREALMIARRIGNQKVVKVLQQVKPVKAKPKVKAKAKAEPEEVRICSICMDGERDHVLGCGHLFCESCAMMLKDCPTCRAPKSELPRKVFIW